MKNNKKGFIGITSLIIFSIIGVIILIGFPFVLGWFLQKTIFVLIPLVIVALFVLEIVFGVKLFTPKIRLIMIISGIVVLILPSLFTSLKSITLAAML